MARTLLRGLAVMEALADGRRRLAEIATSAELDKATASRLLGALVEAGYVIHDRHTGHYTLSRAVFRFVESLTEGWDLRTFARPHLLWLRDTTGETVHLGVLDGPEVVYAEKLDSTRSIRLVSAVGQRMPIYTTSLGKAILSTLPAAECTAIVANLSFTPRTERTITDAGSFLAEVDRTRLRGYSIDREENEENATCVGVSVFVPALGTVGAVSVAGPSFRVRPRIGAIQAATRECVDRMVRDIMATSAGSAVVVTQ